MHNSPTCSAVARDLNAALPGTALRAQAYLLVEYPGPWPAKAFPDNPVDPAAGRLIVDRTAADDVRPLFIRRPGSGYAPEQREFAWAYVDAVDGTTTWHAPATLSAIGAVDWPDARSAITPADPQPLFLVCAHGRRDQCCATRGRPVAAAFARSRPGQTWECSHVGGHRLASVVVALPCGDIYGRVDPDDVPRIIAATEAGDVYLPRLRGCGLDEPAVQAAKIAVLNAQGAAHLRGITMSSVEQRDETTWVIGLRAADRGAGGEPGWQVVVHRRPAGVAPASCGKAPSQTHEWQAEVATTPRLQVDTAAPPTLGSEKTSTPL